MTEIIQIGHSDHICCPTGQEANNSAGAHKIRSKGARRYAKQLVLVSGGQTREGRGLSGGQDGTGFAFMMPPRPNVDSLITVLGNGSRRSVRDRGPIRLNPDAVEKLNELAGK
jgi:hypothetical protein